MIDTTELRRLRDAATQGEWLPYEDTAWIAEADNYESQPFIAYAAKNAHAIADELDELRKRVEHHKSQSIQLAAFACRLQHSREDVPEDVCNEAAALVKKWKLAEVTDA